QKLRCHPQHQRYRKTDDVPVITIDRFHKGGTSPLDRIAAGALAPLLAFEIPLDRLIVEVRKADRRPGRSDFLVLMVEQDPAAPDVVDMAGQRAEMRARLGRIFRLAVELTIEVDNCVD